MVQVRVFVRIIIVKQDKLVLFYFRISTAPTQLKVTKARNANKQNDKDVEKFKFYFDKSFNITSVKPHVVS